MDFKITRNDKNFFVLLKHLYEMQNITSDISYPYLVTNYHELTAKTGFRFKNIKRILTKLKNNNWLSFDRDDLYQKEGIVRNQLFISLKIN